MLDTRRMIIQVLSQGGSMTAEQIMGELRSVTEFTSNTAQRWLRLLLDGGIVAVGNAPTALLEMIKLIKEEGVKPALIVGMPVGFVSAEESKNALAELSDIPWMITRGRKGGSTLVVAAIHALLALADTKQKAS